MRWLCFLLAFLTVAPYHLAARDNVDIIHFKNGDKWTCEIKKLDHGYLYVGLNYVDGDVKVDWREVARIESPQQFVVTDLGGDVVVGSLSTTAQPDNAISLTIGKDPSGITMDKTEVSAIQQTEKLFWRSLHGAISGGFNFSKSDNQTQFSFTSNADYRRRYWSSGVSLQSSFAGSLADKNNLRNELNLYSLRILNHENYFAIGIFNFLHSDEQQLDRRSVIGGGGGKIFLSTDRSQILGLAGAVWTRENYTPTGESQTPSFNSAEALLGTKLEYFRFKNTNYYLNLFVYPSLTDPGRLRSDGNAGIRFKVFKDLSFSLNMYVNYDSRPPRATSKSDFGASSNIGWTF